MPKFQAPEHVTGIFTGGEEYRADKHGVATVPDNAPAAHLQALAAAGWTQLDGAVKPAKAPRMPRARKGGSKAAKAPAPAADAAPDA